MLWGLGVGGLWLLAWHGLHYEWRAQEQYEYGFAVPPLALVLAWLRWREHPAAFHRQPPAPPGSWRVGLAVLAAVLAVFGELMRRHDPSWRLGCGLLLISATLATILWLLRLGGAPLLRAMSFPLAFIWLGLPWPRAWELAVINRLAGFVTGVTVELLNLVGLTATRRGNVIEMTSGFVGLDTACSGIHSLQAALMVSLFLGELLRFSLRRRVLLVLAGSVLAIIFNVGRAFGLAWVCATRGAAAMEQWHNWIGGSASFFTFGLLALSAWLLAGRRLPAGVESKESPLAPSAPNAGSRRGRENQVENAGFAGASLTLAGRDGWILPAAVLAALVGPALWFQWFGGADLSALKSPAWSLPPSGYYNGWRLRDLPLKPAEKRLLQCSDGRGLNIERADGRAGAVYHFFWRPGERPPMAGYAHTPNVCMPSAGWQPVAPPRTLALKVEGTAFPGKLHLFEQDGQRLMVFQAVRPPPYLGGVYADGGRWERFSLLWKAPNQRVAEVLLLYLPDPGQDEARVEHCRAAVENLVQRKTGP